MTVREFITELQRSLDNAHVTRKRGRDLIVAFSAPSSGFCGPQIRPKYLGEGEHGGRYGLSRNQVERVLTMFSVTLPPPEDLRKAR